MKKYDVVVIGSGSGNIVLDAALAQGLKCAQIEQGKFGGTCLTRGCIPTKVMVTAADYIREIEALPKIGVETGMVQLNWKTVWARVQKKIGESSDILAYYKNASNLDVYQGTAYFTNNKILRVSLHDGSLSEEITANKIFIAVGARTNLVSFAGLEECGYLTSETLFGNESPIKPYKSLVIIGGGPIGTEFAHVFAAAGTKVTLLQRSSRLLIKEDAEISQKVLKYFRSIGINVLLNCIPSAVRMENGEKLLTVTYTSGKQEELRTTEIMLAAGVRSNADTLHLENTSLETDNKGFICTNEFLETNIEGVWAFGDVNGKAPFRHKANYEAEIIAHNIFSGHIPRDWRWARYDLVPAVTFTYPQIAHVGLTEEQAAKAGYDVKTAKHFYSSTAKGFALGFEPGDEDDGFVKLVVDNQKKSILGIHIIGPQASILLQPFVNLMNAGKTELTPINEHIASETVKTLREEGLTRNLDPHSIMSIAETMTPHPSLSEVIMWIQYYFEK